jgi:Recombination endonuclease VII
MARPPCSTCHRADRAPGGQKCYECQTSRLAPEEREVRADWRRRAIPVELHVARVQGAQWPPGRRWCSGCQTFVRLSDCGKGAARCLVCTSSRAHATMLTRTYVINGRPFTQDDYDILFLKQGGVCAICERPSKTKRLAVDHDHDTGEVRGLCCPGEWGCNLAILPLVKNLRIAQNLVQYYTLNPAQRWIKS